MCISAICFFINLNQCDYLYVLENFVRKPEKVPSISTDVAEDSNPAVEEKRGSAIEHVEDEKVIESLKHIFYFQHNFFLWIIFENFIL